MSDGNWIDNWNRLINENTKLRAELEQARVENARLREALEYYATANYGSIVCASIEHKPHIYDRCGEVARAALAGKDADAK